jgi:hypothetical protein
MPGLGGLTGDIHCFTVTPPHRRTLPLQHAAGKFDRCRRYPMVISIRSASEDQLTASLNALRDDGLHHLGAGKKFLIQ